MRRMAWSGLLGLTLCSSANATNWVGGDWGGADLIVADNDRLAGVFRNVGTFFVPSGARVWAQDVTTIQIHAAAIVVDGRIFTSGSGHRGGSCSATCMGGGPGGASGSGYGSGSGAGHAGGGGGTGGGPAYGAPDDRYDLPFGSGGSGARGTFEPYLSGGNGGGAVLLVAPTIEIDGAIEADGEDGSHDVNPGESTGGGSGGSITLVAGSLSGTGTVQASGGDSGFDVGIWGGYTYEGGGGSGGRVKVWAGSYAGSITPQVGRGRSGAGEPVASQGSIYAWSGTPTLGPPIPGTAGMLNSATVTGAAPNLDVYLVAHTATGSTPIPGCSGFRAGVAASPYIVGPVAADALGTAVFSDTVPIGLAGQTYQLQAVQPGSCAMSPVLPWTF